jgi:hypothetical protein
MPGDAYKDATGEGDDAALGITASCDEVLIIGLPI